MENTTNNKGKFDVRRLVFTALMGALSIVLAELLSFKTPLMPSFMTFDFSDVPAMMASLTMGPVSGVFVCLIKNIWGAISTTKTAGVGELSNFILSTALVLPAGLLTHKNNKLSRAVIGCLSGSVLMALVSLPSNYFIVFPAYSLAFGKTIDELVGYYQAILPSVNNLWECLLIFNVPFTLVKGLSAAIVAIVLYKKLRPIFSGIYRQEGSASSKTA